MGGWIKQAMEIKEGICPGEPWVTYGIVGTLYCTPETNTKLCLLTY